MDVPARAGLTGSGSAPAATIAALVGTLCIVAVALAIHAAGPAGEPRRASVLLGLFTALFAVRVVGQLVVLTARPTWLPPMEQWNLLPYPILLPIQLVLLGLMVVVTADLGRGADALPAGGAAIGYSIVAFACAYWAAMAVRYGVRMRRRPAERWFGGTIPIVFHCVLAAWIFVLGTFHAAG
jgi:hypothetical protein